MHGATSSTKGPSSAPARGDDQRLRRPTWIVNGLAFHSTLAAEEYTDRLEQAGIPVCAELLE